MVNDTRSMNNDFREGGTDGRIKKIAPDRGGVVDHTFIEPRSYDLQPVKYDVPHS